MQQRLTRALLRDLFHPCVRKLHALFLEETHRTAQQRFARSRRAAQSLSGNRRNPRRTLHLHILSGSSDRPCQRMLRRLLQCQCTAHQLPLCHLYCGEIIRHAGLTLGNGARFVQHHGINGVRRFQRLSRLNQNAVLRANARTDHNSHRRCQSQRAGAGNYQHGNAHGQRKGEALARQHPHNKRHQCDAHNHRHKNAADLVRQLGNRCLGRGGFLHQMHDLHQGGVLAHLLCLHQNRACLVHAARNQLIPGLLIHGNALAGNCGLIHRRDTLQQLTVYRHALAGLHLHRIAQPHLGQRHNDCLAVADHRCGIRRKLHQLANCVAGLALSPRLKEFAQRNQRQDHHGGLEVQLHARRVHCLLIVVRQGKNHLIQREDAVHQRRAGTHRNQRIHVRLPHKETLEAIAEKFSIDENHRQRQQKLRERIRQHVLHAIEEPRQRQMHHIAHRQIHHGNHEAQRHDQPCLHALVFLLRRILSGLLLRRRTGHGCTVARLLHRRNDLCRQFIVRLFAGHFIG